MGDRFMLFAGRQYYPLGGADDLVKTYPTVTEADQEVVGELSSDFSWAHVYDVETGKMVSRWEWSANTPGWERVDDDA